MIVYALWVESDGFGLLGLYSTELAAERARRARRGEGVPGSALTVEPLEVHS